VVTIAPEAVQFVEAAWGLVAEDNTDPAPMIDVQIQDGMVVLGLVEVEAEAEAVVDGVTERQVARPSGRAKPFKVVA
jgi:hypothetical protein